MIALSWDTQRGAGDLVVAGSGALSSDGGLGAAVLLSLCLDRRAEPDDQLDDSGLFAARGWVGDALALAGEAAGVDQIGSRLWLLARAKQVDETLRQAEDFAREALDWLLADGLAAEVGVAAAWIARGVMELAVTITPPAGEPQVFSYALRTS